jgi:hypothetical protein
VFAFPRLATSLAIALLLVFSGTGLVRASDGALPGDHLYPVKRTWEGVRLALVFDPGIREELEVEFEQERLEEVDELLAEGRHETITFAGVVTEQNGDLWVVSGVPVQITPESRLPGTPITVGTSIMLQGRTNAQGLVEAEFIEILGADIVLPTSAPTEIEPREDEDNAGPGNSGNEANENSSQENEDAHANGNESENENQDDNGSSLNENLNDGGDEDSEGDNSGSNQNEDDNRNEDGGDEDNSGSGGGDGSHDESNDNSGGGDGENSNEGQD